MAVQAYSRKILTSAIDNISLLMGQGLTKDQAKSHTADLLIQTFKLKGNDVEKYIQIASIDIIEDRFGNNPQLIVEPSFQFQSFVGIKKLFNRLQVFFLRGSLK